MAELHRNRRFAALVAFGLPLLCAACTGTIHAPAKASADQPGHSSGVNAGDHAMAGAAAGASAAAGAGGSKATASDTCDAPSVGATPLQRLTRDEYANSVRDLLGLSSADVTGIAQDERAGPFAANNVAPVSDLIVEQYMTAAETFARAALDRLDQLVPCDRAKLGDAACAKSFIQGFGQRVYRRPLISAEVAAYRALFASYASAGYGEALRVITQTMLQSPVFLYRVELLPPPVPAPPPATTDLDAYELATRLSFFLWRSTPDDALLAAAAAGKLDSESELRAQTQRLLADPRAAQMLSAFHLQWLELEDLPNMTKDASVYPAFDADMASAMKRETERFVDHVVREGDAKLETLLTASYSFLDGPLFELYGVSAPAKADAKTPVQLDPSERSGLLTQASFLAAHGHANQSAPVQRGKVVIRNVLCEALPDPQPNVNTTPPAPSADSTTRQRFSAHEHDPACAGCHVRIDGIGMGFESYDGIGAFRTRDGKQKVDAGGTLIATRDLDGAFDGAVDLSKRLAHSQEVSDCVATQWLRFALGRLESDLDHCSVTAIQRAFDASGHDVRVLLEAVVVSDAFRKRRLAAENSP
jgi:hypothetical protein